MSFVYPGDQEAIASLKKIPGASALLIYLQEHFTEQMILVENCEQMLKADPANYASIYKLVSRCAEILSCPQNTHPFVPVRLGELKKFAASDRYGSL